MIILPGCTKNKEEKPPEVGIPVELGKVKIGTIQKTLVFTGTLQAKKKAEVRSKIPGIVESVLVDEGDTVSRGELLVELDSKDTKAQLDQAYAALEVAKSRVGIAKVGFDVTYTTTGAQVDVARKSVDAAKELVEQAKSTYNNAKADYDRMTILYQKGAISKQTLDAVTTQYQVAKSRLDAARIQEAQSVDNLKMAKANTGQSDVRREEVSGALAGVRQAEANVRYMEVMLDYTKITAPISGTVTQRNIEPGEIVSPSDKNPCLVIADNSTLYLEAEIPETSLAGLVEGDPVTITVDAVPGKTFNGKISTIVPSANVMSRSFKVKVKIFNNEDNVLKNGMSAMATARTEKLTGIVIPRSWMKIIEGEYYVVLVDKNHRAVHKKITLGYYDEKEAFIKSGLNEGEEVISVGLETLKDGDLLQIVNKKNGGVKPSPEATLIPSASPATSPKLTGKINE